MLHEDSERFEGKEWGVMIVEDMVHIDAYSMLSAGYRLYKIATATKRMKNESEVLYKLRMTRALAIRQLLTDEGIIDTLTTNVRNSLTHLDSRIDQHTIEALGRGYSKPLLYQLNFVTYKGLDLVAKIATPRFLGLLRFWSRSMYMRTDRITVLMM